MEKENINLLQKAINNTDLLDFALGNGDYYLVDRERGTHWFLGIWLYHVIPCLEINEGINEIVDMFNLLLTVDTLDIPANDSLMMHTYTYVSLLQDGRLKNKIIKEATVSKSIAKLSTYFESLKAVDFQKYEEDVYVFNLLQKRFHQIAS